MRTSAWPNIVTAMRIALMPLALGFAIVGWRIAFAGVFLGALTTDFLDGYLARRLNAYSEQGRKLDSVADYVALFAGLAGVTLLWPAIVRREWIWFAAVLGSFAIAMLFTFWRLGRMPCYHTWLSKVTVAGCVVACIPLFAGWAAMPARIVASFQILVGVEEIAIASLIPWHVGEVPTLWHAWRMRRAKCQVPGAK
jgi:phosphatidylglycerophosphate synthase